MHGYIANMPLTLDQASFKEVGFVRFSSRLEVGGLLEGEYRRRPSRKTELLYKKMHHASPKEGTR
jgi:hypothetical protein